MSNAKPLRILFHHWPPYQTAVYRDGNLAMEGPGGNALDAVASSLNFTYTLTAATDYGVRFSNGSWTGMIGALDRGEADAAMSMMALTYERHSVVRFGPCIDTVDFRMLSSSSPKQFNAFSYIRAFDVEVWIAVFVCLICLSGLLALGGWKTLLTRRRKCASLLGSAYRHGWDLFGLLFAESTPRLYAHTAQKIIMVAWLLTILVLANSFGSLLKSKQAVATFKPEVDSVDDLAARPHLTPILPIGNYYETFAQHSRSAAVKKVWERSRSRRAMSSPTELFSDSTLAKVAARRAVVLSDHGSILLQMAGFCERQNIRTFVVASQPLESSPFGYVFSRNIDGRFFRKLFDKFRRILETGLMPKWLADSKGNWQRCIQSRSIAWSSISIDDTTPFFLLWGIMCAMAFCAFILPQTVRLVSWGAGNLFMLSFTVALTLRAITSTSVLLKLRMATNNTQPFRILFHPWPPYQTAVYLDGKLAMGGPGGNALNAVASSLNFTYTLATAFDYGVRLSNGSWTGMVGAVHRGEADAAMSMMALTYERHSVVRFGPCIDTIDFSMLSSSSPKQFDAFSYIRAFDVEVWAAVFGYLICLSCLLALGGWSALLTRRRKCSSFLGSAFDHGWDLFGLLFAESSPRCYVYGSQKLLMVVWLLTVVVLANSFGSLLKSKQAVSTFKPEVDSVDDLAARPHLTPIVPSGNYYETFARHSRSLAVKKVWERSRSRRAMPRVSDLFLDSTLAQVAARRAVILADHGSILLQVTGFCERQNVRTFVVASQPLESSPFGYVFSRSIDERFFRKLFDKFRRILETGLMPKWLADSKGNWQRCIQSRSIVWNSISIDDTTPFFLLWGIMCAMAFCAFICELMSSRMLRGRYANRH